MSYQPYDDLQRIFQHPSALEELPALLTYINTHKLQLNRQIDAEIAQYDQHQPRFHNKQITTLIETIISTQEKSNEIQTSIDGITKEISKLDTMKKNLILSMNIFKRLQILNYSINELNQLLKQDYEYQNIYNNLRNIKELLSFFKPYKSIEHINTLNLLIAKIETKLVDNIFIDVEEFVTHNRKVHDLNYGCEILEVIDPKQKDKLLSWVYNTQLKELKAIFQNLSEAGSLDNLSRRFIYFNNVLAHVNSLNAVFPKLWNVDLELTKIFCSLTKEDIMKRLNSSVDSNVLLSCINITTEFENSMNTKFKSEYFTKIILRIFEPFLSVWINEQDRALNLKIVEFQSIAKIPPELQSITAETDLLRILNVNNVPNISDSSVELFKTFNKILNQLVKITTGERIRDLSNLFKKYLREYHNRILAPILTVDDDVTKTESMIYLTMILNTGDYIVNGLEDLTNKFTNLTEITVNYDDIRELYLSLINKAVINLTSLITKDLRFSWRQFENNNWSNMESVSISVYIKDFKQCLVKDCKLILPLIIRETYSKNFLYKLIEMIIRDFSNNLKLIKPLSILNIETILNDIKYLKFHTKLLPNLANPSYTEPLETVDWEPPAGFDRESQRHDNVATQDDNIDTLYTKFVNNQFRRLETLLQLLLTPVLPLDNLIEAYFKLIGDKSMRNFQKFLTLKNLDNGSQKKYMDSFSLQLTMDNDLIDESPILGIIDDDTTPTTPQLETVHSNAHSFTYASPNEDKQIQTSNPIPKLKINSLEKNLREFTLNSENNINKLNENFKSFGRLFRKDNLNPNT